MNSSGLLDFSLGSKAKVMFKTCRNFVNRVVTLVKIQNAREASHYLTLMHNCKTFVSQVLIFV